MGRSQAGTRCASSKADWNSPRGRSTGRQRLSARRVRKRRLAGAGMVVAAAPCFAFVPLAFFACVPPLLSPVFPCSLLALLAPVVLLRLRMPGIVAPLSFSFRGLLWRERSISVGVWELIASSEDGACGVPGLKLGDDVK